MRNHPPGDTHAAPGESGRAGLRIHGCTDTRNEARGDVSSQLRKHISSCRCSMACAARIDPIECHHALQALYDEFQSERLRFNKRHAERISSLEDLEVTPEIIQGRQHHEDVLAGYSPPVVVEKVVVGRCAAAARIAPHRREVTRFRGGLSPEAIAITARSFTVR